jgi:hypothetical protein
MNWIRVAIIIVLQLLIALVHDGSLMFNELRLDAKT